MSTNAGEDWTAINDGLTDQSVIAMAMDPQDPRLGMLLRSKLLWHEKTADSPCHGSRVTATD